MCVVDEAEAFEFAPFNTDVAVVDTEALESVIILLTVEVEVT